MAKEEKPKEPFEKNSCEYRLGALQVKFEKDGDITSSKCLIQVSDLNVRWENRKQLFDELYSVIERFKS